MIKVGYIATTYGHKGELKVIPLYNDPMEFNKLKYVYLDQNNTKEKLYIENCRLHKNFAIIKFKEILDMNNAEKLRDTYLYMPEDELSPLPQDHFYTYQLIGLEVYEGNSYLGKIKDIIQTGSNDVFIVEYDQKELLIPALKTVVKEIDLFEKRIMVELPEGLLD